ncbi:MAG: Peptidyl-prolyl cis-trans isomerase precursor [Bacteroidota bacterium]|jgi:cyclophilin family peptidyl-prolyl cis-trans isomerase
MKQCLTTLILFTGLSAIAQSKTPDTFKVLFVTTKGDFIIEAYKSWAPIGVERFYQLASTGYYNNNYFFRVEKEYVIQFGIAPDPAKRNNWDRSRLQDEPVKEKHIKGIVAFARSGANSRSAQLFIDVNDNPKLDTTMRGGVHGYPPIGKIIKGYEVMEALNGQYGRDILPLQDSIYKYGNAFLDKQFPGLDKIIKATIIK